MRYVLCLRLENFYVRHAERSLPYPHADSAPLGSGVGSHPKSLCVVREKRVLDADDTALLKGVTPGMTERQARAILSGGIFLQWDEDSYRKAQQDWLDRCLPFTGVIEPSDQHEAFLDLSLHPSPRDIALQLQQALDHPAKLGAASSKWLASLAAGSAPTGHLFDDAAMDPEGFLKRLPVSVLTPVAVAQRERLAFLGYRLIGEVAKIPLQVLKGQFGNDALAIRQAAMGRLSQPVEAVYPPKSLTESLTFEGGTDSALALDDGLVSLSSVLGERLVSVEKQGTEVRLYVELESGRTLSMRRRFNKAVRCRQSAVSALRLMIPRELGETVVSLRVLMPDLQRVPRVQRDLTGHTPDAYRKASAEAALKSVKTVFGDKAVVQGGEIEIPRRIRVLKEWKESTGWR